jgi:hypothetical protein
MQLVYRERTCKSTASLHPTKGTEWNVHRKANAGGKQTRLVLSCVLRGQSLVFFKLRVNLGNTGKLRTDLARQNRNFFGFLK